MTEFVDKFTFANRNDNVDIQFKEVEHKIQNIKEKLEKRMFLIFLSSMIMIMFLVGFTIVAINNQISGFDYISKKLENIEKSQDKLETMYIDLLKENGK